MFESVLLKGELVHDGQISDIIFPNPMIFREFVFSLPRDYACDAAEWVWMQQVKEDGEYRLLMGMNISALMNSGGADWGDGELKTVRMLCRRMSILGGFLRRGILRRVRRY